MLHLREAGAGEPVLLLHGLFGSAENLGAITRSLSQRYHTLAVDLPGHGRSSWQSKLSLASMAETFAHWLAARQAPRLAVVGHSLGGKIAMELALRHPERVSHVAVLDAGPQAHRGSHEPLFEAMLQMPLGQLPDRAAADAWLAERVAEPAVRGFLLKNLVRGAAGFEWRLDLVELRRAYPDLLAENSQGRFEGPALFLRGGASDYLPEIPPASVQHRFPHARYHTIAGAGHWLHAEQPQAVAAQLLSFLRQT